MFYKFAADDNDRAAAAAVATAAAVETAGESWERRGEETR